MNDLIDRWFKICISVLVAVLVWIVIMMTVVTIHEIRMDERGAEVEHEAKNT